MKMSDLKLVKMGIFFLLISYVLNFLMVYKKIIIYCIICVFSVCLSVYFFIFNLMIMYCFQFCLNNQTFISFISFVFLELCNIYIAFLVSF